MSAYFSHDNTAGFTADELDEMNKVLDWIMQENTAADEVGVADVVEGIAWNETPQPVEAVELYIRATCLLGFKTIAA